MTHDQVTAQIETWHTSVRRGGSVPEASYQFVEALNLLWHWYQFKYVATRDYRLSSRMTHEYPSEWKR